MTMAIRADSLKEKYFSTPLNSVISVICLGLLGWIIWHLLDWAILNSVWSAEGGAKACKEASGACWSVIAARWRLILFGLYPFEEQWRSGIACTIVVIMTILSCLPSNWSGRRIMVIWVGGFVAFYVLLRGGVFGLTLVPEIQWGGLTLTVFIFLTTALIGMPTAMALALMRRSNLPWISRTTGVIIDTVRSLPLLSILFTFAVILPFVLPQWLHGDKLYRVILGMALFFAAYQAEIIRGGMQGVPGGQEEAAQALGLNYWQRIGRIVMPQAFKNALPATINQVVITFKETSLVIIIGFFEILASGNAAYGTGEWTFAFVEVYAFIALIYFSFTFSLSRYGAYLEQRMAIGER